MNLTILEYCYGCQEPIYDGEIVVWCNPITQEETGGPGTWEYSEPFCEECA